MIELDPMLIAGAGATPTAVDPEASDAFTAALGEATATASAGEVVDFAAVLGDVSPTDVPAAGDDSVGDEDPTMLLATLLGVVSGAPVADTEAADPTPAAAQIAEPVATVDGSGPMPSAPDGSAFAGLNADATQTPLGAATPADAATPAGAAAPADAATPAGAAAPANAAPAPMTTGDGEVAVAPPAATTDAVGPAADEDGEGDATAVVEGGLDSDADASLQHPRSNRAAAAAASASEPRDGFLPPNASSQAVTRVEGRAAEPRAVAVEAVADTPAADIARVEGRAAEPRAVAVEAVAGTPAADIARVESAPATPIVPAAAPVPAASTTADASVAAAMEAEPTAPMPQDVEFGSPAQQVAEALRDVRRMADGSHRLSLQLHPEELGAVQLEVAVRDGQVHLRAVAETDATRRLLAGSMPELRDQLADAGVSAGSLEVGAETAGQNGRARGDADDQPPTPNLGRSTAEPSPATPSTTPAPESTGRLDVRI